MPLRFLDSGSKQFSDKDVIAQTDLTVQRTEIAEAVLTLSYELEHSQTMLKAYQAKGDTLDENYVSMDEIWTRVSSTSGSGDALILHLKRRRTMSCGFQQLSKEIVFQNQTSPKSLTFVFSNDDIVVTKTITFQNTSYPLDVSWTLTPLKSQVNNASLYLTTNFDLRWQFEQANIPGLLNWVNPWDAPAPIKTANGNYGEQDSWAVASFAGVNLKDNYLGVYDDTNQIGFAFKFMICLIGETSVPWVIARLMR